MAVVRLLNDYGVKGERTKIAERRLNYTGEVEIFGALTNYD